MSKESTQAPGSDERFRTTRWSLISEIRNFDSKHSREILNTLFQDYWKPVYCYIVNRGIDSEKARDLTQDFFCNILFENNLFEKAQKSRGKFRSFLLTALKHFLISQNRYQTAKKRNPDREILNIDLINPVITSESCKPFQDEESFHYTWITSLLDRVSEQVKNHYDAKGKKLHWIAFDERFRKPILYNAPAPSLSSICQKHGIEDEVRASNMITSVKRSFQKMLRSHIREYVCTDQEVDEELSELLAFLRKKVQD